MALDDSAQTGKQINVFFSNDVKQPFGGGEPDVGRCGSWP
jgi:hypothetical protein